MQNAPVNPAALRKTTTRLASQGQQAIAEAVALRGRLAALQAMTADAAYGAIEAGLRLRRGLYQRNQMSSELKRGPIEGLVEPARPRVREEINWALLRGILTALFVIGVF